MKGKDQGVKVDDEVHRTLIFRPNLFNRVPFSRLATRPSRITNATCLPPDIWSTPARPTARRSQNDLTSIQKRTIAKTTRGNSISAPTARPITIKNEHTYPSARSSRKRKGNLLLPIASNDRKKRKPLDSNLAKERPTAVCTGFQTGSHAFGRGPGWGS